MDSNDSAIVICSEAKSFAIQANKNSRFRAVACKDSDDAEEAAGDAAANVIIIDSEKATRAQTASIIQGWLGGGDYKPVQEQQRQQPARQAKPAEQRYQQQKSGRKGAGNAFKSALGIDEDSEQQASEQGENEKAFASSKPISIPKLKLPKINLKMPKNITKSLKDALGLEDEGDK